MYVFTFITAFCQYFLIVLTMQSKYISSLIVFVIFGIEDDGLFNKGACCGAKSYVLKVVF